MARVILPGEGGHRGNQIHEVSIKDALRAANSDIDFDLGARKEKFHPKIDQWQGIFHNGRHVGSMGRGLLPEFNIYRQERKPDGSTVRAEALEIGWRETLENVVRKVPGVTWEFLCAELGVDYKKFSGDPKDLEVA